MHSADTCFFFYLWGRQFWIHFLCLLRSHGIEHCCPQRWPTCEHILGSPFPSWVSYSPCSSLLLLGITFRIDWLQASFGGIKVSCVMELSFCEVTSVSLPFIPCKSDCWSSIISKVNTFLNFSPDLREAGAVCFEDLTNTFYPLLRLHVVFSMSLLLRGDPLAREHSTSLLLGHNSPWGCHVSACLTNRGLFSRLLLSMVYISK